MSNVRTVTLILTVTCALVYGAPLAVGDGFPAIGADDSVAPMTTPGTMEPQKDEGNEGKLKVGDLVFINVFRHPELSTTAQIDPHGNISLPYIGSISLVGLSEGQASARVSMEMIKVLKNPRVTVTRSTEMRRGMRTPAMTLAIIPLHNADADSLSKSLQGMSSDGGSISADTATNSIIVTDTPAAIKNIQQAVRRLDQMQSQLSQVKIEAKIAEVHTGAMKELGIRWFAQGSHAGGGYYPLPTQNLELSGLRGPQMANANEQVGGIGENNGANAVVPIARRFVNEPTFDRRLNIPVQVPTPGQLFFGFFNKGVDIGSMLDALVANNKAQLLANPMILTVNNKQATIQMVDEYPYTNLTTDVTGRSNYLTKFLPIGIQLSVTPHVLRDEGGIYVKLEMEPQVSFSVGSSNGIPIRSVRSSSSVANVRSGQTLVIAGIFSDDTKDNDTGVPVLSKIPLLQRLFKHTEKTKSRKELMIFVTPTVYDSPEQVTWEKMMDMQALSEKGAPMPQSAASRAEARRN